LLANKLTRRSGVGRFASKLAPTKSTALAG